MLVNLPIFLGLPRRCGKMDQLRTDQVSFCLYFILSCLLLLWWIKIELFNHDWLVITYNDRPELCTYLFMPFWSACFQILTSLFVFLSVCLQDCRNGWSFLIKVSQSRQVCSKYFNYSDDNFRLWPYTDQYTRLNLFWPILYLFL